VEGDKVFGIRSFSVRMGQKKVFWMSVALLQSAYAAAIVFGLTSTTAMWSRVAMVLHKLIHIIPCICDHKQLYYESLPCKFRNENILIQFGLRLS